MGERYIISGAQIGVLQVLAKANKFVELGKEINNIIEEQFVGQC